MADAAASTAFTAGIVPVEFPVESEIAAREIVAIEIAKAKLAIDAEEIVRSLFRVVADIAELRIEDRRGVLADGQVRPSPVEHDRPARAELQPRRRRDGHAHPGELRVRMIPALLQLGQKD